MHCSLVDLSDELHLKIIQELLKHDQLFHEKSLEPDPEVGLQDRDDEFLYHRDLMNWSCTSRYFRSLLAPYIFRSIKLRNDEKSGASVDAVLKGSYGDLVREIYFLGTIPPSVADDSNKGEEPLPEGFYKDSEESDEGDEPISITLPPVVDSLLSDLSRFSSLESLSMGFVYPYDSPFDEFYDAEDIMENENPEAARAIQALMATTYNTLLKNKPPQLRALEIRKFVGTFTEPYESQEFHDFLSHVEHFTLTVRGGDNGAGWEVNTCDAYLECVARFDELFFDHLKSATNLTLRASHEAPIGLEGRFHACLALEKEQMPLLKALHLEHVFICQELVDFAAGHTGTLERLTLHNCYSNVNVLVDNFNGLEDTEPLYWKHFFNALHGADLKRLSHLEIRPYNAPLTFDEGMDRDYNRAPEERAKRDNVQQIRQVLSADKKRRVFGYATLDDKYGSCYADEEENEASFEKGEDQVAYDRLMAHVNTNAAKGQVNPLAS